MEELIRPASPADADSIWSVLEPVIRAGETYCLPRDMTRASALEWWLSPAHEVFVAQTRGLLVGTYFLRPNAQGGGSHVANCGYVTGRGAEGKGIGRAMCIHSIKTARLRGFTAMQFNFVVSANTRAIALWKSCGFDEVGRLPAAFRHPLRGLADALVMYRAL